MSETGSLLVGLVCPACGTAVDHRQPVGTCPSCGGTLFAEYDLDRLDGRTWLRSLRDRPARLWRYRELLPVGRADAIVSLGEGGSPIFPLGAIPEAPDLTVVVKDDGGLPTGSFKARGMTAAVSRAKELGLRELYVPSAGNAGVALAAYGARAGMRVRIYLPERTPTPQRNACSSYGAEVRSVPGTIREAGETARTTEKGRGSFDVSTLREPFRVEGKKTMGLEIFEAGGNDGLPDAILYPAGGGTGLIGMEKAFSELARIGLLHRIPRLYAVQPDGCAPVVRALAEGAERVTPWADPHTVAPGLLVPSPFASERILAAVRSTKGGGVTVTDGEIVHAMRQLAERHGVSASPEAAAPYAALARLRARGDLRPGETVLLYLTGTGLPFSIEELERAVGVTAPPR